MTPAEAVCVLAVVAGLAWEAAFGRSDLLDDFDDWKRDRL